ncbi:MAG TPA: NAD-dependent epimerase/dehydratase family protein [Candidatus Dormibacteraeota bacterium]|nr:NAD-dependent epimerase/dehydratase family protein [Candidatus Dormibacteraeota bacterium]
MNSGGAGRASWSGSARTRVAITGATGFVGSNLASRFERDGWSVARTRFRLGDDVTADEVGADALVHCAYDFRPVGWADIRRVNVEGTRKLLAAASGKARRIVVLSTISAFDGCRSLYGKAKLEIEAEAARAGAAVLRPGLVFVDAGASAGGMYGSLERSARAPVVPLIGGGGHCQYLVHIDDLYAAVRVLAAGEVPLPNRPVVVASPRCWTMRDLVMALARRQGRTPRFVSVPWQAVWLGLKSAELARLRLGYRSDSVVSLVHQDPHPDFSALKALGVTARDFSSG